MFHYTSLLKATLSGWGIHKFSGQSLSAPPHPLNKELPRSTDHTCWQRYFSVVAVTRTASVGENGTKKWKM